MRASKTGHPVHFSKFRRTKQNVDLCFNPSCRQFSFASFAKPGYCSTTAVTLVVTFICFLLGLQMTLGLHYTSILLQLLTPHFLLTFLIRRCPLSSSLIRWTFHLLSLGSHTNRLLCFLILFRNHAPFLFCFDLVPALRFSVAACEPCRYVRYPKQWVFFFV